MGSSIPMHHCTNAPMHQRTNAPMDHCTNVPMHQCTNAPMHQCTNALMHHCTIAPLHQCTNVPMHQRTNASMHQRKSVWEKLIKNRKAQVHLPAWWISFKELLWKRFAIWTYNCTKIVLAAQCCNPSREMLLFGRIEYKLLVWFNPDH